MGYSGSGKSTLAKKYGERYGIEVFHLDTINFDAGWVERTYEEKERDIRTFLDAHEDWVIDGNYTRYFLDERTKKADTIILLLFSPLSCLCRAIRRYLTFRGKSRPDMKEGCPEKLDREFIMWILRDGRTDKIKKVYRDIAERYPQKTVIIRDQRQLDRYMAEEGL